MEVIKNTRKKKKKKLNEIHKNHRRARQSLNHQMIKTRWTKLVHLLSQLLLRTPSMLEPLKQWVILRRL